MPRRFNYRSIAVALRDASEARVQLTMSEPERHAYLFGVCVAATRVADAIQHDDPSFNRDVFLSVAGAEELDR